MKNEATYLCGNECQGDDYTKTFRACELRVDPRNPNQGICNDCLDEYPECETENLKLWIPPLKAENERLRAALENALLWTDEENDVSDWRDEAQQALEKAKVNENE